MSFRSALLFTLAVAAAAETQTLRDCDSETCDVISLLQSPNTEVHMKRDAKDLAKHLKSDAKDLAKDLAKDTAKDLAKAAKEGDAKDLAKDLAKDAAKDLAKDAKEAAKDPEKAAAEPELLQQKESVEVDVSKPLSGIAALAEFLAMTLFVMLGCGSAMALKDEPGWLLQVSLVFGLAITCLAYAIGHYSGGQINCAVTLGLCITGNCTWSQGGVNFGAQMCGSVFGALILSLIFGEGRDKTGGLGTNAVAPEVPKVSALIAEIMGTFLLVYVVLEVACNPATKANSVNAPIAIGLAVFLAHCFMIPLDGCSINPTRTFGPMLVRKLTYKNQQEISDHWVFWVGPLLGAALAAGVNTVMTMK